MAMLPQRPLLGQGGGRADVILGLLGQGGTGQRPPYNGGNPPTAMGPPNGMAPGPGSYNPGGSGIGGANQHMGGMAPPTNHFQDTLHGGGRFMDMLQGISQQQFNHMAHGMAPGGFGGDFSHVSPQFLEHLAHLLRPQGPQGTPGASMFRLPRPPQRKQQPRAASFRQALIQRAMNQ